MNDFVCVFPGKDMWFFLIVTIRIEFFIVYSETGLLLLKYKSAFY